MVRKGDITWNIDKFYGKRGENSGILAIRRSSQNQKASFNYQNLRVQVPFSQNFSLGSFMYLLKTLLPCVNILDLFVISLKLMWRSVEVTLCHLIQQSEIDPLDEVFKEA